MFRVIQLFLFVFGRIVHRTIRIVFGLSLKPLFGTSLVACTYIVHVASQSSAAECCIVFSIWDWFSWFSASHFLSSYKLKCNHSLTVNTHKI